MEQDKRIEAQRRLGEMARKGLNIVLVANLVVLLAGLALLYCGNAGIIGPVGLWVGLIILIAALLMTVAFYLAYRNTIKHAERRLADEAKADEADEAESAGEGGQS